MKTARMIDSLRSDNVKWDSSFPRSWRWYGVIIGDNARQAHGRIRALREGSTSPIVQHIREKLVDTERILKSNGVIFQSLLISWE